MIFVRNICRTACLQSICYCSCHEDEISTIVFRCVFRAGDVMLPLSLRFNSDGYFELLNIITKPWFEKLTTGKPYVSQQDFSPFSPERVRSGWQKGFTTSPAIKSIPLTSLIVIPVITMGGGRLINTTAAQPVDIKAQLTDNIKEAFEALTRIIVKDACASFWSQIEGVLEAKGGFFE